MFKSKPVRVALLAITLSSLASIPSAEAHGYGSYHRSYCGYPEYGYLAPYPFGGNSAPRVKFVPVMVFCTAHPFVVWKYCNVDNCW